VSGTKDGAQKGVETKRQKYGEEHFSKVGAKGGAASKGRTHSAATRKKISQSKKQRWNYNHTRLLEPGEKEVRDENLDAPTK
jgi:hypothetical protein